MNLNKTIKLALEHHQAGRIQQAESLYKKILIKQPNNAYILHMLGVIRSYLGDFDSAIRYLNKALYLKPNDAFVHYNLGNILRKKGQLDEAVLSYRKSLQLHPDFIDCYYNLGNVLEEKKLFDEAVNCYQQALRLNPNFDSAYCNLANILIGKGQLSEAIDCLQKATSINPTLAAAYISLGNVLREKGQFDEAINCLQKAIQLNPNLTDAYSNLGAVFADKGRIDQAEEYFRRALTMNPEDFVTYSNLLFVMNYNAKHDAQAIFSEHLNFSNKYEGLHSYPLYLQTNDRSLGRRLKIGYISPDFKRHAVSYFIEAILIAHNRAHFEIFCYSNSFLHDEVTLRIQEQVDHWQTIAGMSDNEVAGLIRKDKIDILINLAGHTANNRILIFAQRPAPVQISWIGYLATTGLSTTHYKIADKYTDPPGETERFYTEKLVRLPESLLCYLPDKDSPQVGPLPALTSGHITFGSFNNYSKISSEVFILWARILEAVPDSRLILKGKCFHDKTTYQDTINIFKKRGIAEERLTLQPSDPSPKHLESYNLVDIGLDTFPFNGATTTCEALWMGVPVITLEGTAYHARAGVSLLSNVGLPELIAKTSDEYLSIAVNVANDFEKLRFLRTHLRDMMKYSPICNATRFTANLETCYREMWEMCCTSA